MDKKLRCQALEYLIDLIQNDYTFETIREGIEEGSFVNRIGYEMEVQTAMKRICDEKTKKKPKEINCQQRSEP